MENVRLKEKVIRITQVEESLKDEVYEGIEGPLNEPLPAILERHAI